MQTYAFPCCHGYFNLKTLSSVLLESHEGHVSLMAKFTNHLSVQECLKTTMLWHFYHLWSAYKSFSFLQGQKRQKREHYGLQRTQTKNPLEPPLKLDCTLWLHELWATRQGRILRANNLHFSETLLHRSGSALLHQSPQLYGPLYHCRWANSTQSHSKCDAAECQ